MAWSGVVSGCGSLCIAAMRRMRKLYVRDRTRYVRHHALPFIVARTSRSVAGFYLHGHLRRHAAGDAPCGLGIRSAGAHGAAHRDCRAMRTGLAAGAAPAASTAPAMAATCDRDAVREHP